jgi:large subunit ribosomal protein L37Ae
LSGSAKKVGSVARFGPRYGVRIRSRILEIEKDAAKEIACPRCGAYSVGRVSTSIYACRHCGHKYAGRAYVGQFRKTVVSHELEAAAAAEKEDGK